MPFQNIKKKFNILYIDPPWNYRDKATAGKRGAEFKYPCMTLTELGVLPMKDIAEENCAMFLWSTSPMLPEAIDLMNCWGWQYKNVAFTWIKQNKGKLAWGMGNYTRSNPEYCLLGIRGKLERQSASVHSVVISPREEHSKKPDEIRDRIVTLFGDIPRIELFARKRVEGWDSWGNGLDNLL